jgi:pyrroline-5-carboxylate reductase
MGGYTRLGFIGGGNMGEALIKGLIKGDCDPKCIAVYDVDYERQGRLKRDYGVEIAENNLEVIKASQAVFLAVKPQQVDDVLNETADAFTDKHLLISIAAGVTISHLQATIPASVPIIRAMPNTPALVLSGATALAAGAFAEPVHMERAVELFKSVGMAVEVDEKYMDVVTGLSGSGPAYVLTFLEALVDGAVRMGLPRKEAMTLAVQTILGTTKMVLESGDHPAKLRDMVTSPGGTTAAGLHALESGKFRHTVMEAVASAAKRSKELGG